MSLLGDWDDGTQDMRTQQSTGLPSFLLCLLTAGVVFAQKAEPLRIAFKQGTASIRLQGSLKGHQDREYALNARHGQTLSLSLVSSPAGAVTSRIYTPNNTEIQTTKLSVNRWSVRLPENGDYEILVQAIGTNPTCTYKLSIAVR